MPTYNNIQIDHCPKLKIKSILSKILQFLFQFINEWQKITSYIQYLEWNSFLQEGTIFFYPDYEDNFQKPTRHPERSKCIKKYDVTIKLTGKST